MYKRQSLCLRTLLALLLFLTKSSSCVLSRSRFSSALQTRRSPSTYLTPSLMLCTNMSTPPSPLRVNPKDLYAWASRELLDECSSLLSARAIRENKGDPCSYDHRAFAKRHDDNITVLPFHFRGAGAETNGPTMGSPFSTSTRWFSRVSVCVCPSPGLRGNY